MEELNILLDASIDGACKELCDKVGGWEAEERTIITVMDKLKARVRKNLK